MLTIGINSRPKLSVQAFQQLRDFIYSVCGIYIPDSKMYLIETRLQRRLEESGIKTFEDYYYYLMYDKNREKVISSLINSIVTNETSFFRDPGQLDAFIKGVVPAAMNEKEKNGSPKTLRLWSAASSTGEEPYTLAMMLVESGLLYKGWRIEVLASDICDTVLKSAEAATYEKYSLRNTPEAYLRKYFTNSSERYRVNSSVKEMVTFRKINLVDTEAIKTIRGIDVIFCRNVLIYFDDNSKKKVVGHLYDSLNKGGYLFIGFSETLFNITRVFRPASFERTVVYQKA
ncbi:MAG: protein-glutamate O-methyltransferase CheR [Deltaproteobacteria bacterium]